MNGETALFHLPAVRHHPCAWVQRDRICRRQGRQLPLR
jgi:hypothetical protein